VHYLCQENFYKTDESVKKPQKMQASRQHRHSSSYFGAKINNIQFNETAIIYIYIFTVSGSLQISGKALP